MKTNKLIVSLVVPVRHFTGVLGMLLLLLFSALP